MGKAPSWVVRWGITVLFVIFAVILLGCWFIKYPEFVKAPVEITTLYPPVDLIARYDGLIDTIAVRNGDLVGKGNLMAVLANPADYRDVVTVECLLEKSEHKPPTQVVEEEWITSEYVLGSVQASFTDFQRNLLAYRQYLATSYIPNKKRLLEAQIAKNRQYYARLREQRNIQSKDADYEVENLSRDSILYADAVISEADYKSTKRSLLAKENSLKGFDATLVSTELNIIQTEQQLDELSLQEQMEIAEYERGINASRQQLLSQIAQWREQYVISSPSEGAVSLLNYWSENQRIPAGEKFATIVPEGEVRVIGRMKVPTAGFGKVEEGQRVNVRLNGWPYMEYGVLNGVVSSISLVPEQNQAAGNLPVYVVELEFPAGLVTSYRKELPLIRNMDGEGEIITKDKRLIERFIDPITSLFKNR
jgi:multidrug resistance efflux pump